MDKFLYLIRQTLQASFRYFAKGSWKNDDRLDDYIAILSKIPLNPKELRIPNGLRYHMIDIYADELEKIEDEEMDWPIEKLLKPLKDLKEQSPTKSIRERAGIALEDERVSKWEGKEVENTDEEQPKDSDEWGGIQD
jgi:ribosomal RNA-processing protein 1